jgi:hypothetical protein
MGNCKCGFGEPAGSCLRLASPLGVFMLSVLRTLLFAFLLLGACPAAAQDVKHHAKGAVELGWSYFNKGDADDCTEAI